MKTARILTVVALAAALLAGAAGDALASLSNTVGAGAKATSLGGSFAAIADDFTASYYNPAGLARVKHREAVSGWLFGESAVRLGGASDNYHKNLSGPVLGNVFPFDILGMRAAFGLYNFWPKDGTRILRIESSNFDYGGGCVTPVQGNCGGVVSPGGRGVNLRIPTRVPYSVYIGNEQQQHLDFVTGLGLRINDYLSVGAGLRANLNIKGDVNVDFTMNSTGKGSLAPSPPGDGQFLGQIDAAPTFGWIVGALIDTQKGLRIGGAWREEARTTFRQNLNSRTGLPTAGDLSIVIPVRGRLSLDTFYQPQEVSFGVAYDVNDRLMVTAQLDWQQWSRYRGNTLNGTFQGIQSFIVPPNQGKTGTGTVNFLPQPNMQMRNIWIQRYGIQYQLKRVWRIRAGFTRIPSVVKDPHSGVQTRIRDVNGNIIGYVTDEPAAADADKQIWSFGMGLEQDDPFEWFELPTTIDVTYQFIKLQGTSFKTVDPNNPHGNFNIGGDQWILWLTNTARF